MRRSRADTFPFRNLGEDVLQIVPIDDGVLIVIGDKSGKELPAAVLVSLLVSVSPTLAATTTSPAGPLTGLKAQAIGRSVIERHFTHLMDLPPTLS